MGRSKRKCIFRGNVDVSLNRSKWRSKVTDKLQYRIMAISALSDNQPLAGDWDSYCNRMSETEFDGFLSILKSIGRDLSNREKNMLMYMGIPEQSRDIIAFIDFCNGRRTGENLL